MKTIFKNAGFALAIATVAFGCLRGIGSAQGPTATADRIQFVVVESFDAKHSDDTPGHVGRVGGLGSKAPNVALADDVYREAGKVGKVTHILYDRAKESLEIEFNPIPGARVPIGSEVYLIAGNRPGKLSLAKP